MNDKQEPKNSPNLGPIGNLEPPANAAARRKLVQPIIIALLIGLVIWLAMRSDDDQLDVYRSISDITFADPALESCVKSVAQRNAWTNVGRFVSLRCNNPTGKGIKQLGGIEHFVVLKELNLAFNEISDISLLSELPHLEQLELSHNRISAIPEFVAPGAIAQFSISHNAIESIDANTFKRFSALTSLSIAHNRLSSRSPSLKI
jgi:hypothetical protein